MSSTVANCSEAPPTFLEELMETVHDIELFISHLQQGECSKMQISTELSRISKFLSRMILKRVSLSSASHVEDEDIVPGSAESSVPENVQAWLNSTFTRRGSRQHVPVMRKRMRSLVQAMRAGIVFDRIFRRLSSASDIVVPPMALLYMKEHLDSWAFDVFHLNQLCTGKCLKVVGYEILFKHNIVNHYSIDAAVIDSFLDRLEQGYEKHGNPYHNAIHAADVAQTCHHLIVHSPLVQGMTDLEMFSVIFAALIHDFEHTGTTNNFHVKSDSDLAILYNDKSVLENYHVSVIFRLLQDPKYNITASFSRAEYMEFRSLVIHLVLATDMSAHFTLVQNMKNALLVPDLLNKNDIFAYLLHCCDISHPAKQWELHQRWTQLLMEEFFRQGDREKELGLPYSPLCDRQATLISESQIGFINFIVEPCFVCLSDMMDGIGPMFSFSQTPPISTTNDKNSDEVVTQQPQRNNSSMAIYKEEQRRWLKYIQENKQIWADKRNAVTGPLTVIQEEETED